MRRIIGKVMPLEWILLACGAVISILYATLGVPYPMPEPHSISRTAEATASQELLRLCLNQLLTALDNYCLIILGFVAWQVFHYMKRTNFRLVELAHGAFWKHISTRFYPEQLLQDLRFIIAILVMFLEFALLKNLIPQINPRIYDDWFMAVDRLACAGVSCSELLHSALGRTPEMLESISGHYLGYYNYMSLVLFLFIACAPRARTHEFLCAFVTLFLFGTFAIYLVPTWGPVYHHPEPFEFMRGSPIFGLQQNLWEMKVLLEQNRSNTSATFMISGFPSLHVAVVTLGSIYLRRVHLLFALLSWGFCILTINSTLYLGWHYLLDDIGALALVWVAVLLARLSSRRWDRFTHYHLHGHEPVNT